VKEKTLNSGLAKPKIVKARKKRESNKIWIGKNI